MPQHLPVYVAIAVTVFTVDHASAQSNAAGRAADPIAVHAANHGGRIHGVVRDDVGRGVGGGASVGTELADRTLLVGGARLPVHSLIVGPEMDGRDGLVGMDVLRGTVLTVSGDPDRPVLWQVASS